MAVRKSGKGNKKVGSNIPIGGKETKPRHSKPKSKLENLTAKKIELRYRDRKGKLVAPEKLNGRKYVKWEIWRYSEATKKWKKLNFGKKWEPKESKLKRPKTKTQIETLLKNRVTQHNIEVRQIKGEVFFYTASP